MSPRTRGHFGVGVWAPKRPENAGSILRSAHAFGADYCFIVNPRPGWDLTDRRLGRTDTTHARRHVPTFTWQDFDALLAGAPHGASLVAVELSDGARMLDDYEHPERAMYLLGPEDGNVPGYVLERADAVVQIPSAYCLNVAVAAGIVLHHRIASRGREVAGWAA